MKVIGIVSPKWMFPRDSTEPRCAVVGDSRARGRQLDSTWASARSFTSGLPRRTNG